MRKFLSELFSDSSKVSSKRFISIFGLLLLAGVIVAGLIGITINSEWIWSLISLITGSSAMTLKKGGGSSGAEE